MGWNHILVWRRHEKGRHTVEPYLCVAMGDYQDRCAKSGKENALQLTPIGEQRQATRYAKRILSDYIEKGAFNQQS